MRFLATKTHGYIDYMMGLLLMASPWLFGFNRGGAETWVPVILGAGMYVYSLFTDYELGASRMISMRTHLTLDVLGGTLLVASPWLFGFDEYVTAPHLVLGFLEIGASLITKAHPRNERAEHRPHYHSTANLH